MPQNRPRGFTVHGICWAGLKETKEVVSKERWLDKLEIYALLRNPTKPLRTRRLNSPPCGTIVFFDSGKFDEYKQDGYEWKNESHAYLKFQGRPRIHAHYAHNLMGFNISRRTYWRVNKDRSKVDDIVMVHYFKQSKEKKSDSAGHVINFRNQEITFTPSGDKLMQPNGFNHPTAPTGGFGMNVHNEEITFTCAGNDLLQPNDSNNPAAPTADSAGFGTNVDNHENYSYLSTAGWDELLQPNDSSHQTAPTGGEALVGNQSNETAVRPWGNDDGVSPLSPWVPISGDANNLFDAPVNDGWMG